MNKSNAYVLHTLSDEYSVAIYRNPETIAKEEVMQDFLYHVEYEFDMTEEEMDNLKALVVDFLGYDIKKVESGEKKMMEKWSKK